MFEFFSTFPKTPAILPVIHITDNSDVVKRAIANARVCADQQADGVWLIDHFGRPLSFLMEVARAVRETLPNLWVGVNSLNTAPTEGFDRFRHYELPARWIDSLGMVEGDTTALDEIMASCVRNAYPGLIFGGVSFKYIDPSLAPHWLQEQTRKAIGALGLKGVVTTSGDETGSPPMVGKLRTMKAVMSGAPLAVASGISPENVATYVEHVDAILVSSSLTDDNDNIIPERLRLLRQNAGR